MSRNQREGHYAGKMRGKHRRSAWHRRLRAVPSIKTWVRIWIDSRNWIPIDEFRKELGIEQATDLLTGEIGRLEAFGAVRS